MNSIVLKCTLLSLLISLFIPHTAFSQVTFGSLLEPNKGALLDLKDDATTSTKGLGLPRVSLVSNSSLEPCLSSTEAADANQKLDHVGLVVYNVTEKDGTAFANSTIRKEDMLCKGIHVWNGEKWQPLIPYFDPDVTRSAPMEGLVITRGPSGSEVTTYTTAYFHGYTRAAANGNPTTGSVYVCDPSKVKEVDAGQWMTMNLRTKYMPGETTELPRWNNVDTHINPQYEEVNYPDAITKPELYPIPLTEEEKTRNGYLYNWAAATGKKDTYKALDSEFNIAHDRVQGICPNGWHLPGVKEWTELFYILRAQSYLFSTVAYTEQKMWTSNNLSQFSGGNSLPPEKGGMDLRMLGTRHRAPKAGDGYMEAAFYWSSTSGPATRDPAHNNDWTKWDARGFNLKMVKATGVGTSIPMIPTASTLAYRSRVLTESVRCKKD